MAVQSVRLAGEVTGHLLHRPRDSWNPPVLEGRPVLRSASTAKASSPSWRRLSTRVAYLLLVALLGGCATEQPLAVVVDVRTDLRPELEFTSTRIELASEFGGTASSMERLVATGDDFLEGQRVGEFVLDEPGTYALTVTLLAADGRRTGSRRVLLDIRNDFATTVTITRSCVGVVCPDGDPAATECVGGRCVEPRCADLDPDACGLADCTMDSECEPAQACAAGICATDVGVCFFAELPGVCASDEWCNPDTGCVRSDGVVCAAGYGDCDGMAANGCETPIDTVTDCGRCGAACAPANGTGDCVDRDCTLLACDPGFNDCDGLVENGCENDGPCVCDMGMCTFMCSVACTARCAAGSNCTVVCEPGTPCSVTAEMGAQVTMRCGGSTNATICGQPECSYQCDVGCNCS